MIEYTFDYTEGKHTKTLERMIGYVWVRRNKGTKGDIGKMILSVESSLSVVLRRAILVVF